MRARFIGDPQHGGEGPDSLSLFGAEFNRTDWTLVPPAFERKISGNSHFEIDMDGDGEPDPTEDEMRAQLDAMGVKYRKNASPETLAKLILDNLPPEAAQEPASDDL